MKIPEDQIETKKIAGVSGEGKPILYILSKGGLHAFFTKDKNDGVVSLGAAPHRAIATWLAEQRDPELKWNAEFIEKSEEFIDDLQKHEESRYLTLRKMMFANICKSPATDADAYLVYDVGNKSFTISDYNDLHKSVEAGEVNRYDLIRHISLTEPAFLAEDHPKFSDIVRSKRG